LAALALAAAAVLVAASPARAETFTAHIAPVIQGRCWGGPNQRWWFRNVGNDVWEIHPTHSDKCLDVTHQSQAHGAPVIQGNCWSGPNQRWRQVGGNGVFSFQPQHISAGQPMCLDVAHNSGAHLARIVQARCSGGLNQSWQKLSFGTVER
jgi:hypothetical protein